MMGSSSVPYKGGGPLSSSSSNLSPLAPPFMVDKSFTRSNSTNPSLNFPELPVYGTVFDPAGPFSGGLKFGETEPLGTSAGVFGYPAPQSSNSDVYYGVHNSGAGYDPFTYDQFQNTMPNCDGDDGVKPYFTPFISTASPCKDTNLGLSYDLLSGSGAHFTGYTSPPVDHTQGASSGGGEYKPKWSGFWGGLSNAENEKWTGYPASSGYLPLSDLSSNKSSLSVEGSNQSHLFGDVINSSRPYGDAGGKTPLFGDVGNNSNLKQGVSGHQGSNSHGEEPTFSDKSFDIFGGTYHFGSLGIHQQAPTTESTVLQKPAFESITHFSVFHQKSHASSEGHLSPAGNSLFGFTPTTSTSPNTMTSTQYGGSNSSALSSLSGIQVNSMATETTCSINPSTGRDRSHLQGPKIPLRMEFQPGVVIRKPVFSSKFGLSNQKEDAANGSLHVKLTSDEAKFSPQGPLQCSSDDFRPETDDAEVTYSMEKHSSGSDLHNPAEDSPCWKGASSNRFSPFSITDAVVTEVFANQEDGSKNPRPEEDLREENHIEATLDCLSVKLSESTFREKPTVTTCTSSGNKGFGSGNQKSYCIDLNIPDGLEFLDDCRTSTKDLSISNNQRSGLYSDGSLATGLIPKEAKVLSTLNISEVSVVPKRGDHTSAAVHNSSGGPSNNGNHSSSSTVGDTDTSKCSPSTKQNSDSRLEINVVMKTMMKLSQMLHSYCLGNPAELTEQHLVTLKQIISHLNASKSVMVQQIGPSTVFPSQDNLFLKQLLASEMVNRAEVVAGTSKHARTVDDLQDCPEDDVNELKDNNMTQAIKKVLYDNFKEGIDQPELLYKNLWLEAEAALCVMTAKARIHSMKVEMEKSLSDRVKDKENSSSPKISGDGRRTIGLLPEHEDLTMPDCDQGSQKSIAATQCNDTEATTVSISQHRSINSMQLGRPKELISPFLYDNIPYIIGSDSVGMGAISHTNDGDSVMIGYQILKSHCDDSDTLKDEGKQSLNENLLSQDTSCVETPFSGTINHSHDFDSPIMASYQILKSCFGNSEIVNNESKQSFEENYDLSGLDNSGNESTNVQANDVMARYQILKCRMENSDFQNKSEQSTQGDDYLIDGDSPIPDKQFLNLKLLNSINSLDDDRASIMARFSIIQNRVDGPNSLIKDPKPTQVKIPATENGTEREGWGKDKSIFMGNIFSPFPNFSEEEDAKKLQVNLKEQPSMILNKLSTEIFEGWYENDRSSSDWEHVSKEELRRQN